MNKSLLSLGLAAAGLSVAACSNDNQAEGNSAAAQTPAAQKAAGNKTIAAGLAPNSRFVGIAKAAGLDQTLAGPGPYTVLVADDAAFAKAPAGTLDAKPENRAQLTGVLTNMILPGTVMAADIGKAIDNGKGKAILATMGGGALTATRDGGNVVLTDGAGNKAVVTQADQQFSNGVVHRVDALLMPSRGGPAPGPGGNAAAGNTAAGNTGG